MLTEIPQGSMAQIVELQGGTTFQDRMRSMGLREGSTVTVVTVQPFRGPLVVRIGRQCVTLGRGMAEKVRVEPR